jgi:hypothetical protein
MYLLLIKTNLSLIKTYLARCSILKILYIYLFLANNYVLVKLIELDSYLPFFRNEAKLNFYSDLS